MNRYLIIADDLTGSNDTGIQLKRHGYETIVTMDPGTVGSLKASYVLNTESRPLKGAAAFDLVKKLLSGIDMSVYNHVIKKVDSTLRGSIAHEVAAVDAAYEPELVVFMPAFPDLGRTTEDGIQKLNGTRITQTELANDPITPVTEDDIQKLLASVYNSSVTHVGLESVDKRSIDFSKNRVFACDSTTNAHMQVVVAAAIKTGKRVLWVGSAGIVDNLMEIESPRLPAIALVASLSQTSKEQVLFAKRNGVKVLTVPSQCEFVKLDIVSEATDVLNNRRDLVLVSAATLDRNGLARNMGTCRTGASSRMQKNMGGLMSEILNQTKVSGIFITGGDTAMGFLKEIGATGLRAVTEVQIGIPLMQIVGGKYAGFKIITKAGAFGQQDALFFALRKLKENLNLGGKLWKL